MTADGKATDMSPCLLEVGVEEIPARFLAGAERNLGERLSETLRRLRLLPPVRNPSAPFQPRGGWWSECRRCCFAKPTKLKR